ncbi:MAG: hypothetical protein ACK6CT_16020 [Planctomycetia bacterium]
MRVFRPALVALSLLAFAPGNAPAAPLDLTVVPADARWLMHVDMEAARGSVVLQKAWDKATAMHPHLEQMAAMAAGMIGTDPRKDLRDVTFFGTSLDKTEGVMVIRGRMNRAMLEKMAERAPDHETMQHRGHVVHRWTQKLGLVFSPPGPASAAMFKDDVLVIARSEAAVQGALDTLDGTAAAVGDKSPLAGRGRPGSFMVARAAAIDPKTRCPVLRSADGFRVAIGEAAGKSFYRAKLDMNSAAAAGDARSVVAGMESLARLRWGDDAAVMRLVAGLEPAVEGDTCMISWDAPAAEVWEVVDKAATEWMKKRAERRRWRGRYGGRDDKERAGKCPLERMSPGEGREPAPLRDDEF